eukprot:350173-Chlamydomonas_euryale.AAC.1
MHPCLPDAPAHKRLHLVPHRVRKAGKHQQHRQHRKAREHSEHVGVAAPAVAQRLAHPCRPCPCRPRGPRQRCRRRRQQRCRHARCAVHGARQPRRQRERSVGVARTGTRRLRSNHRLQHLHAVRVLAPHLAEHRAGAADGLAARLENDVEQPHALDRAVEALP